MSSTLRHLKTILVVVIIVVIGIAGLMIALDKVQSVSGYLYQPIMKTISLEDAQTIVNRQIRFSGVEELKPVAVTDEEKAEAFLKTHAACHFALITLERKSTHSEANRYQIKKLALTVADNLKKGFYTRTDLRPLYVPLYLSLSSQDYDRDKIEKSLLKILGNLYSTAKSSKPAENVEEMSVQLQNQLKSFETLAVAEEK